MGGVEYKTGTHKWGNRDYDMISYLYDLELLNVEYKALADGHLK